MNSKLKLIIPLFFVIAFIAMGFSKTPVKKPLAKADTRKSLIFKVIDSSDILIGNRTSDSTGVMTISSSDIQQSIVSGIPYLNGISLSNPSLMVTPVTAYILLNGTNTTGNTVKVAIQILSNEDSTLTYHHHDRTLLHICTKNSDCGNCQFITLGNVILTCQCGSQAPSDSIPSSCIDNIYLLK